MNTNHCFRRRSIMRQSGQALAESIVACSLLVLLLLAVVWVGKFGELEQANTEAVRFAAWERTVYHMQSGDERKTLYASDQQIANETFQYTYLTPEGQRGIVAGNGNDPISAHHDWGTTAAQFFSGWLLPTSTFNSMANTALQLQTTTAKTPARAPMGFDPTHDTLTSLKLDTTPYDTVTITATISMEEFFKQFFERRLGIVPAMTAPTSTNTPSTLGSLSLITNSWAAPGSIAVSRIFSELNPLSSKNYLGHYVVNNDTAFNLSEFYGGQAGFAGNYRVDKIGLNAADASTLFNNALSSHWSHNAGDYLHIFNATNAYLETLSVAPKGTARFDVDWAMLTCKTRVPQPERLQNYRQDARCKESSLGTRTMSFFDNPAWRYSTMEKN